MLTGLVRGATLVAVLLSSLVGTASATTIAYEWFEYSPPPSLPGDNGGVGFNGPWNGDANVVVPPPPGLQHPLALPGKGSKIGGQFKVNRELKNKLTQPVYWVSFLISSTAMADEGWLGLASAGSSKPLIYFGRRFNNYFIQSSSGSSAACCVSPVGSTDLLVARIMRIPLNLSTHSGGT